MISSSEYSAFLNWNPKDPITIDSVAHAFIALVSMVRDGYQKESQSRIRSRRFVEDYRTRLHKSRCSVCGLDDYALDLVPSIDSFTDKIILGKMINIFNQSIPLASLHFYFDPSTKATIDSQLLRDVMLHEVLIPLDTESGLQSSAHLMVDLELYPHLEQQWN
ncbi:hypothetical protein BLNAU_9507 [Blattamonas nauphoetae]|uniref:Uncharacterized protein n=1 Tax=Blattamonas nauphoetae TaxID=2049346 RepID=A0ABQ9XVG9_9EUKA|nr:hypothetical protein BLNAU_9507 [Blattamonas nauphoetae]